MSITGGKVSRPIGWYEMASLLGEPEDIGSICTSDNINIWAKFKPIRVNQLQTLEDSQFASANYGITIPFYSNITTLNANFALLRWRYDKPWGYNANGDYPYRLTDFNRYWHNAPTAVPILKEQTIYRPATTSSDVIIKTTLPFITSGDETALQLSDLLVNGLKLSDMYLGIAMRNSAGNLSYYFTNTEKGLSLPLIVKPSILASGTYTCFLFASSVILNSSQTGGNLNGTMCGLNASERTTIIVSSASSPTTYSIDVRGSMVRNAADTGWILSVDIIFSNYLTSAYNFMGMMFYAMSNSNTPPTNNVISSSSLGNVMVAANSSEKVSLRNIAIPDSYNSSSIYLYAMSTNNTSINSGSPILAIRPADLA